MKKEYIIIIALTLIIVFLSLLVLDQRRIINQSEDMILNFCDFSNELIKSNNLLIEILEVNDLDYKDIRKMGLISC